MRRRRAGAPRHGDRLGGRIDAQALPQLLLPPPPAPGALLRVAESAMPPPPLPLLLLLLPPPPPTRCRRGPGRPGPISARRADDLLRGRGVSCFRQHSAAAVSPPRGRCRSAAAAAAAGLDRWGYRDGQPGGRRRYGSWAGGPGRAQPASHLKSESGPGAEPPRVGDSAAPDLDSDAARRRRARPRRRPLAAHGHHEPAARAGRGPQAQPPAGNRRMGIRRLPQSFFGQSVSESDFRT